MPDAVEPQSLERLEDARFLTGHGNFVADLNADGQAHAVFVRSDYAHAGIKGVDTAQAVAMPGVIGVYTDADLAPHNLNPLPCSAFVEFVSPLVTPPRRALARGRVRHVGDPVALVVAETAAQARDAAEAITIDYAPLPAVADATEALADGAPAIWDDAPGNLAFRFQAGDAAATRKAMEAAAHVVELELVNNRITAMPLEPRAGIGGYDAASDRYTLNFTGQGLHGIRDQLAEVFGLPKDRFHLTAPDVGGGFGMKNFIYPEWVLLPWAAKRLGRPVKWVAERGEDFAAATHGRDMRVKARLGLDADMTFLALEAEMVSNMGAYLSSVAPNIPCRSAPTAMGGVYAVPHVFMDVKGAFTNTACVDAYRGAGKPEANYLTERLVEAAARRLGVDPLEIRRRNVITAFPHTSALGIVIDGGRFAANIDDAEARADRAGFAARRAASEANGKLRGLGFACFLETARAEPEEGAEVLFTPAGRIELRLGTESNGQGHETTFAQIAGARFGLPLDAFDYIQADTDRTRMGHGHGGARTMHMGGG
ncbi:MAG: xanthine dehydrogenase family protein molybdopterin-binding subunit, partial [Rhodospirillaceae bacterium]